MCSLNGFPPPPLRGYITLSEINGHLVASPAGGADINSYVNKVQQYPKLSISHDIRVACSSKESLKSAFLPGSENVWKRAAIAWNEHGVISALGEISSDKENKAANVINYLFRFTLSVLQWIRSLHCSVYPHLMLNNEDLIEEFASVTEWNKGMIRSFAWHPHASKFAVALRDDSVKILTVDNKLSPVLKYRQQKGICDLAWRPLSSSNLAVACLSGIAVWNIDPTSLVTRPSSSHVQWLTYSGHYPVTCVQWSPCGKFLLSSSARDSSMIIWDVSMNACVPLHSVRGGGVSFVRWSPDGRRVFAATPSKSFRVWETRLWTWDWWSSGPSRCQAACWSPDGKVLLTALRDEPVVYSLSFSDVQSEGSGVGGSKTAIPVINLTPVLLQVGSEHLSVGGNVQCMVWDKTGQRLAMSFSCKAARQEFVAIFRTQLHPTLDICPCGFVRGRPGDIPQCLAFQNEFEDGALLTVCWSSGEISHIPFIYPLSSPVSGHSDAAAHNNSVFTRGHTELYSLSSHSAMLS